MFVERMKSKGSSLLETFIHPTRNCQRKSVKHPMPTFVCEAHIQLSHVCTPKQTNAGTCNKFSLHVCTAIQPCVCVCVSCTWFCVLCLATAQYLLEIVHEGNLLGAEQVELPGEEYEADVECVQVSVQLQGQGLPELG